MPTLIASGDKPKEIRDIRRGLWPREASVDAYLKAEPAYMKPVQLLFPVGTSAEVDGKRLYVIGYGDPASRSIQDVTLILSRFNPRVAYEQATRENHHMPWQYLDDALEAQRREHMQRAKDNGSGVAEI